MDVETRLRRLSAYASPFAASSPIDPSPASPSDFIGTGITPALAMVLEVRRMDLSQAEIDAALARDEAPIPAPLNRENYGGQNHFAYWLSGYADYLRMTKIATEYDVNGGAVFDFGGSTGRVFRNFHYQSNWDIWSNDFKQSSVVWNLANFPPAIKAFQGMYFPSVPMEDRSIDLVLAMSVFTHIDETETNWLMELRRILRPRGLALITTHNEVTWSDMAPNLRRVVETHNPDVASLPSPPSERFVSNFRDDDPYRCNTFHTDNYVRRQWSRYFDVLDIISIRPGSQAVVVLRRPG